MSRTKPQHVLRPESCAAKSLSLVANASAAAAAAGCQNSSRSTLRIRMLPSAHCDVSVACVRARRHGGSTTNDQRMSTEEEGEPAAMESEAVCEGARSVVAIAMHASISEFAFCDPSRDFCDPKFLSSRSFDWYLVYPLTPTGRVL